MILSLFKQSYINEMRRKMRKEYPKLPEKDFDEIFEQVLKNIEDDTREKLKEVGKEITFSMYEMAENNKVVIKIDGVDIGEEIRQRRQLYNLHGWIEQRKKYFGGI